MASLKPDTHTISRGNEGVYLALESSCTGTPIVAEIATGCRSEEKWSVEILSNSKALLRNQRYPDQYISFEGKPRPNKLLLAQYFPRQWFLRPFRNRLNTFFIIVPSDNGNDDGQELVIELLFSPPRLVLRPLRPDDSSQTWTFNKPKALVSIQLNHSH